jgi:hypothetical protein
MPWRCFVWKFLPISAVSCVCLVAVSAQTQTSAQSSSRVPTIDQSLEMHSVSSPRISPDGKHVVYEQSRTDWEANAFETDLWIADTRLARRIG